MVKISFPDGAVKEFESGITTLEIAQSISPSLAKKALAGKIDGKLIDVTRPIEADGALEIVTPEHADALDLLRHSAVHLFAQAARRLHPNLRPIIGPAIKDGFYEDTDNPEGQLTADQLPEIEAEMSRIVKEDLPAIRKVVTEAEAREIFKDNPFKQELIDEYKDGELTVYTQGEYSDLCRGPHVPSTGFVKYFKLLSVAGAYWRGDSNKPMMQRVYGTAWFTKEDLENNLQMREEAKERDHRKIGRELDLFFNDASLGAGTAYWLPDGATIRRVIQRFVEDREIAAGYLHVNTPNLMNLNVYKQSGHWQHYREDMFPPMDMGEGEELELRPMNCPSHIAIYKHDVHSYRELPIRIAEFGNMHRYEKSGALSGLQRVRVMQLNDGHTFVMPEQIQEEFGNILQLVMDMYHDFGINDYSFRLSLRDPNDTEKYFPDDAMWENAEAMLRATLKDLKLDFVEAEGEAAFYGPKLDIQVKTALGNEETLSTIQLDFLNPENFDITYVGADGEKHRPVMIHRGVISTLERFIAYLIELYKGAFPTWLAPWQVQIIPVSNEAHGDYAWQVAKKLQEKGLRVKVDESNEKVGYKVRQAQVKKIPYELVVGDKEAQNNSVTVRRYGSDEEISKSVDDFVAEIMADVENLSRIKK
ncbi:MAG: threonine--tRNA ligase [Streptococcaceae bacterium]|jgi:threonyl-tRNA synthetase|nr:threonine--tRNA ligase [Streptococcaceae bacterium]